MAQFVLKGYLLCWDLGSTFYVRSHFCPGEVGQDGGMSRHILGCLRGHLKVDDVNMALDDVINAQSR
jgi:hypothetical protein